MKDRFSHWDTTPLKVKYAYKPESYTALEWRTKKMVDHMGDNAWEHCAYETDLSKLEV